VAPTYTGDLRAGDRMLDVPARTLSLSAMWSAAHWSASVTASRAEDWIYYDRLTLAKLYEAGNHGFTGPTLRRYWITYPGVTHLRAAVTSELRYGFSLAVAGENLLDEQTGEPDNVTVLPGRALVLSLRRAF
jgi:iron complex outermembrane receptor protein